MPSFTCSAGEIPNAHEIRNAFEAEAFLAASGSRHSPGSDGLSKLKPRFFLGAGKESPSRGRILPVVKHMMPFVCNQKLAIIVMGFCSLVRVLGLTGILIGILSCLLFQEQAHAFSPTVAEQYGLTLAWDDSNPDPEVISYRVYYGTASEVYTNVVMTGDVSSTSVTGLSKGVTYYFAITAVDADGVESDFSNEVSYREELPVSVPVSDQYSLTLAWNPIPIPGIISCYLYYGTVSGEYLDVFAPGNVTTATIPGLSFGVTYYFAITTVDADGRESEFSNEISHRQELTIAPLQIQGQRLSDGQFRLTLNGPAGHTYDIEASDDFTTWSVIGTVTLEDGGSLEFTDTEAPNFPQRFYRTRDVLP